MTIDDMRAALDKAKSLMAKASEHEQFYIRAAEHEKDRDKSGEPAAYRREMEYLIDKYPDDIDAQAFLALALLNGYDTDGHPRDTTLYSQSILRNLLAAYPENAAANHYWIHALEGSARPKSLSTAPTSSRASLPIPGIWFTCLGTSIGASAITKKPARHSSIPRMWTKPT